MSVIIRLAVYFRKIVKVVNLSVLDLVVWSLEFIFTEINDVILYSNITQNNIQINAKFLPLSVG